MAHLLRGEGPANRTLSPSETASGSLDALYSIRVDSSRFPHGIRNLFTYF